MSRKDDDEKAYTTYDDIVGRSIRRGTRKAVSALTFGLLGDDPEPEDPLTNLALDAAREAKIAYRRSKENK